VADTPPSYCVRTVPADTPERTYAVQRMSCAHCRSAVAREVARVPGVSGVSVELESGRLTVTGKGFTDDAITRAVEAAGYEVRRG
jgi:copper chaperone